MVAAQNGHLEVVKLLLDKGADVNQANKVSVCMRVYEFVCVCVCATKVPVFVLRYPCVGDVNKCVCACVLVCVCHRVCDTYQPSLRRRSLRRLLRGKAPQRTPPERYPPPPRPYVTEISPGAGGASPDLDRQVVLP